MTSNIGRAPDSPTANLMNRRTFYAAVALFGFTLIPILKADRFYIDDLGRSLNGYLGWGGDARPLANVVMELLNLGTPLVDLSPVTQLLAVALFARLAVSLSKYFLLEGAWRTPLALLPFFGSPFFLENLSYKFDVLTMSLGACLAAWVALARPTSLERALAGVLGLVAVLCLYQPAISVFSIFALLDVCVQQVRNERFTYTLRMLAVRFTQFMAALGAYAVTAGKTVKGDYASSHATVVLGPSVFETVMGNLRVFADFAVSGLVASRSWTLIALIAIGLFCMAGCSLLYVRRHWKLLPVWQSSLALVLVLVLPAAAVAAVWGPMLFLRSPVLVPRVQIGVGALGTASAMLLLLGMERMRLDTRWQVVTLIILSYPLIAFATVYGNTLGLQKEYEGGVVRILAEDLRYLKGTRNVQSWSIHGSVGMPPVARHNALKYPFLCQLVPVYLTQGWGWASDRLAHSGITLPRVLEDDVDISSIVDCQTPPAIERQGYRLYVVGSSVVVWFSSGYAPNCARAVRLGESDAPRL